jgi:hypothetical protein
VVQLTVMGKKKIRTHFRPKLTIEHELYLKKQIIPEDGFSCCSQAEAFTILSHLFLGSTARMASRAAGLNLDDFRKMRKDDTDFDDACEHIMCAAGHRVVEALYNAASQPDAYGRINTSAVKFWLVNREKEDWAEQSETSVRLPEVSPDALLTRIAAIVNARRTNGGSNVVVSGRENDAGEEPV